MGPTPSYDRLATRPVDLDEPAAARATAAELAGHLRDTSCTVRGSSGASSRDGSAGLGHCRCQSVTY